MQLFVTRPTNLLELHGHRPRPQSQRLDETRVRYGFHFLRQNPETNPDLCPVSADLHWSLRGSPAQFHMLVYF